MAKITPVQGSSNPHEPDPSSHTPPPMKAAGGSGGMTEFMKLFTPEERDKFMNVLVQNCSREIEKSSKRYIEELRRQRQEINEG